MHEGDSKKKLIHGHAGVCDWSGITRIRYIGLGLNTAAINLRSIDLIWA